MVIAIEGAHATGKSTLAHALVCELMRRHKRVAICIDVARRSPFVEAVVMHGAATFDLATQLHLFGAQVAEEQILARTADFVVCDKSMISAIAYARVLLEGKMSSDDVDVVAAMRTFARAYSSRYDGIVLLSEFRDVSSVSDPLRLNDTGVRELAQEYVTEELAHARARVLPMPDGLHTQAQVRWILAQTALHPGASERLHDV